MVVAVPKGGRPKKMKTLSLTPVSVKMTAEERDIVAEAAYSQRVSSSQLGRIALLKLIDDLESGRVSFEECKAKYLT